MQNFAILLLNFKMVMPSTSWYKPNHTSLRFDAGKSGIPAQVMSQYVYSCIGHQRYMLLKRIIHKVRLH